MNRGVRITFKRAKCIVQLLTFERGSKYTGYGNLHLHLTEATDSGLLSIKYVEKLAKSSDVKHFFDKRFHAG